jgi:hypothetical protein
MEVDGMYSGREVVEFEFERDARPLIPKTDITDRFALSIFEFDFGLGRASGLEGNEREEQSEGESNKAFHEFKPPGSRNYIPIRGWRIVPNWAYQGVPIEARCPQRFGVYCEEVSEILTRRVQSWR